jgi:osmotically-inducible protein OsmY
LQRWQQGKERRHQDQLAWQIGKRLEEDKSLSNCQLEVVVRGDQVELKGTTRDLQQRRYVMEVVGAIAGVGKVKDSMHSADDPTAQGQ